MDDGVNIRRMIKAKALITKKTLHEREGKEDFVGFATGLSREYGAGVKNNEGCAIFMTQPLSVFWWREEDSNLRPLGYEPNELPTAPPRDIWTIVIIQLCYIYVNTFYPFFINFHP